MDVVELLQQVASAAADAKAKDEAAVEAQQHLEAVKAEAQATYDAAVGAAQKDATEAQQAANDAKVAGQRLRDQLNEALGGVFSSDPRVRVSH